MADKKLVNTDEDTHIDTGMGILSPSGYNTYVTCPKKFWLVYHEKLREPGTKATLRGSLVHKVCEEISAFKVTGDRRTWKTEILLYAKDRFEYRWNRYKSLHSESPAFKAATWVMIKNFCTMNFMTMEAMISQMPHFGIKGIRTMTFPRKLEEKYNLKEEHGIHGTADEIWDDSYLDDEGKPIEVEDFLEFVEKGDEATAMLLNWCAPKNENEEITIGDIKTSKIFKLGWSEEYDVQLQFYALMHYLKYGVLPTYGVVRYVAYGKESYTKFSLEDVLELHGKIKQLQDKIRAESEDPSKWPANIEGKFCKWCWHSTAKYDDDSEVVRDAPCQEGWKKWSENGDKVHGFMEGVRYLSGDEYLN